MIQFFHHIEHGLLQIQALIGHNLFDRPVPTSIVQLWVPRVELHLFYNTIVFIPMVDRDVPTTCSQRDRRDAEVHVRVASGSARCRLTLASAQRLQRPFAAILTFACLATGACGRPVVPADGVVVEWKVRHPRRLWTAKRSRR